MDLAAADREPDVTGTLDGCRGSGISARIHYRPWRLSTHEVWPHSHEWGLLFAMCALLDMDDRLRVARSEHHPEPRTVILFSSGCFLRHQLIKGGPVIKDA